VQACAILISVVVTSHKLSTKVPSAVNATLEWLTSGCLDQAKSGDSRIGECLATRATVR
jgi:hypothetical protein